MGYASASYIRTRASHTLDEEPEHGASATDLRDELRVQPGTRVRLEKLDPGAHVRARQGVRADRHGQGARAAGGAPGPVLGRGKRSVLIVLQGIDAAGKDGTINKVMEAFNPQGCPVTAFKVPSAEELAHDYLWRVHSACPARARSASSTGRTTRTSSSCASTTSSRRRSGRKRYDQINDFERMLTENGTTIVKFFLYDRPRRAARSGSRRATTTRRSTGSSRSATSRSASSGTTTRPRSTTRSRRRRPPAAPWYVIPANRKWFRNLAVVDDPRRHDRATSGRATRPPEDLPADLVIE